MSCSFAVWGCKDYSTFPDYGGKHDPFIKELHINFWNINSKKIYCLDFGLAFTMPNSSDIADKGSICVFFPFKKRKEDLNDLSSNLDKNRDLVTSVFNEYLIKSENIASKFLKLELTNKGSIVMNTKLDFINGNLDQRVKVENRSDGTLVIFKLKGCLSREKDCVHYIRFRIFLNEQETKKIVKTFYPSDSFLKSNLERSDIIDFRVNEQRNLPSEISSTLACSSCTPQKYHFFVIRDMNDECSLSGNNYQGCRILESETWGKYFTNKISFGKNDPMIYHWKITHNDDKRLSDFSAVAKFKNTKAKITKILAYIFYGLAISFMMKYVPTHSNELGYAILILLISYISIHFFKYRK
ncbi:hypothetical protein ABRZ24_06105 [Brenneria populi]|uniref:Uncharacterized protein n=1 Tax=Brenneria populi TaxID=1505588 RepID=A0ABU6JN91_9GAMM|nr:hypothetical protein [Brenneria populi Li et al. 2015]